MNGFGKVAVLMGGDSAEREISLKSGTAVLEALLRQGVDAHKVDAGRDLLQQLEAGPFDRAFIVLHGRGGEDGVVQGALEQMGLPYTGSGVLGSSLGMDKYRCKLLWSGCQLPTPPFVVMQSEADVALADGLGYPQMIKPAHEGSSIGMSRVMKPAELKSAWQEASQYDGLVLAETYIDGPEYTIAILGDEALPVIRLETPNAFYDYQAKYQSESTQYHCPCGLSSEKELELQQLALRAFQVAGAKGWGRVDLMLDSEETPWLIEVNTVPGMTDHSLVPMAAKAAGISFDQLVVKILATSMEAN
jgi:D-alanine-D-alanine ligase